MRSHPVPFPQRRRMKNKMRLCGFRYAITTLYGVLACIVGAATASAQDDHGGSIETATLLSIGPPQIGTIDDTGDVDYFRIDLAGSATVQVDTAGKTDTRGELLDGSGALIASDDDSGPGGNNFLITEAL